MFPGIVAGADGVVADLVGRTGTGTPFAAMRRTGLPHRPLHDLAKLERGAARRILLVPMMALDDLHVGTAPDPPQQGTGPAHQIHRNVDGQAHARRLQDGDFLGRFRDRAAGRLVEARRRHHERHAGLHALRRDARHGLRQGKIDHDIGGAGPASADDDAGRRDARERAGVGPRLRMAGPLDRGHEIPGRRV